MARVGAVIYARQAEGFGTVAFYDQLTNPVPDLAVGPGERLEVLGEQDVWYSVRLVAPPFDNRTGWVKKRNTHAGEPCAAQCGKPSWNGEAGEFCSSGCKAQGAPAVSPVKCTATSSNGTGTGQVYLAELRAELPHVDQNLEASDPKFPDDIGKFRELYPTDDVLQNRLRNKVLVCGSCGKPCAFTMAACNSCGSSLSGVPITYNDNIFMGFVYGIQRGPRFPYTISMRKQTESLLCFDDPLALSVLHLNAIPTDVYIPDLRYLFANPPRGLKLIEDLFDIACVSALEMFWSDDAFRQKFFGDEAPPADAAGVAEFVLSGCNYPPSMYQLHLQFVHPPMLPFHYDLATQENHFHHGRFFPYDYLRKALALGDAVRMEILDDTNITDIVEKINGLGVNYDAEQASLLRKCRRVQDRFKAWHEADFACRVVNGKVLSGEKLEEMADKDARVIHAADTKQMQTYGRPYDANGKPTGTYYRYPKDPDQVGSWP